MRKSTSPNQVSPTNNAKRNSRTSTASTLTGTFTSTTACSQIYGKPNGGVLYKAKPTPQKKKEWDNTIHDLKVYKLSKEELEAKKRSRISKNQEFYRVDTPSNERPRSAPPSRPKKTPMKEQPNISPKTPKSLPTPTKNTIKSNTKKTTSTTPKKTFTPQSAAKIASTIDLDSTQFLSPLKLKTPPQLDLLPLTSRILQQEISETSSESEKDKSLNISEEFFQEDDYHRFGEWSSNIQQNSTDLFKVPSGMDNARGNELDLIKNELSELRSNMIKLDPNARIVEKKLEERKQKEVELEEKTIMLQHELEISRQSYAELEDKFSKYREETEDREMSMLQKIDELEQLLRMNQVPKSMYPPKMNSMSMNNLNDMGNYNYLVDNQHSVYRNSYSNEEESADEEIERTTTPTNMTHKTAQQTDYIINGRPVLKNIATDDIARSPTKNQSHFPQPIMRFETNPLLTKVTSSKTRVPFCEENKENMMTEYSSEKLSDDVSPFATYRYPTDEQDGAIEIHRPLIVGRDFSNTILNNNIVTKQHKDFSPPNSGKGLISPPQSKSNNEIDSMLSNNGKVGEEKNNSKTINNNLENISMDTPMDTTIPPSSSSNSDSERRVFSMPPPHPVAAQHYYRKLFSEGQQEPTRKEDKNPISNNNNLNNNFTSNNAMYPPYSGATGFVTPYAQPIYTMMPQTFQQFPAYGQPNNSTTPTTISSIITDSLLSLVKYLIFFLLSLGIFKVGKRWILSLLKNYKIIERVPSTGKEFNLVVKPEIQLEKREEEEPKSIIESVPTPPPKEQHKESAKTTSGETSLDFNSMMFLQREIFDLKLSLNEMKTKMGEMNNQSISNTLLKQMELQHEQQKMILSQTLSKHDHSSSPNELQRELNNLRNDLSQMKGMMMVNHQPYTTVAPPIIHREPMQYYPKYSSGQSVSPATSSSSNENKVIEHNLTSSAKAISPPTTRKEKSPSPVNYFNSYSATDPTNYESGISKRSQPSIEPVTSQSPTTTEQNSHPVQETPQEEESKTPLSADEEKTEESQFEYGQQTFEPITEEEYDQVYGEYLNSLGKRFEDQVNFHTHVEPSSSTEIKTENLVEEAPSQEINPVTAENNESTTSAETPTTSDMTASKPFDDVDVFNILKTPTLSFDELFVKASPKTTTDNSTVFNNTTSMVMPTDSNNTTNTENSFVTPQASSSIQEAARELRKTQLTAKQKKSKIFGVLLAPEKKKKKKKPATEVKPSTPETQEIPKEPITIETSVLSETETPIIESTMPLVNSFAPEIPISMNTLSNPTIEPSPKESFEKFEMYDFEKDDRFQRMLSLTADDEDCPINKDDPNFLLMQKGIYFKQLLGNDEFDLEAYMKEKGIEMKQQE